MRVDRHRHHQLREEPLGIPADAEQPRERRHEQSIVRHENAQRNERVRLTQPGERPRRITARDLNQTQDRTPVQIVNRRFRNRFLVPAGLPGVLPQPVDLVRRQPLIPVTDPGERAVVEAPGGDVTGSLRRWQRVDVGDHQDSALEWHELHARRQRRRDLSAGNRDHLVPQRRRITEVDRAESGALIEPEDEQTAPGVGERGHRLGHTPRQAPRGPLDLDVLQLATGRPQPPDNRVQLHRCLPPARQTCSPTCLPSYHFSK